jgi:hypothetical protein
LNLKILFLQFERKNAITGRSLKKRREGIEKTSEITETKGEKTEKLRFIFEVSFKIYLRDEEEASTPFLLFLLVRISNFQQVYSRTPSFSSFNHHRRFKVENKR